MDGLERVAGFGGFLDEYGSLLLILTVLGANKVKLRQDTAYLQSRNILNTHHNQCHRLMMTFLLIHERIISYSTIVLNDIERRSAKTFIR